MLGKTMMNPLIGFKHLYKPTTASSQRKLNKKCRAASHTGWGEDQHYSWLWGHRARRRGEDAERETEREGESEPERLVEWGGGYWQPCPTERGPQAFVFWEELQVEEKQTLQPLKRKSSPLFCLSAILKAGVCGLQQALLVYFVLRIGKLKMSFPLKRQGQ